MSFYCTVSVFRLATVIERTHPRLKIRLDRRVGIFFGLYSIGPNTKPSMIFCESKYFIIGGRGNRFFTVSHSCGLEKKFERISALFLFGMDWILYRRTCEEEPQSESVKSFSTVLLASIYIIQINEKRKKSKLPLLTFWALKTM